MTNYDTQLDPNRTDLGDFLKVAACSAVMLQTVLGLASKLALPWAMQRSLIPVYDAVKFTAPAFIFGILFTTLRTTPLMSRREYGPYLQKQWHALMMPTILWTAVYLIFMPGQQQHTPYHSIATFNWQFINGNAAPHLWYNTMMLQFIILMPLWLALSRWLNGHPQREIGVLIMLAVGFSWWLAVYDLSIFNGLHQHQWYLADRLFISYLPYAILGISMWLFYEPMMRWLRRWWWGLLIVAIMAWLRANTELRSFGAPVKLANAPYLKPSITIYALCMIGLICVLADWCIRQQVRWLGIIHFLAIYAYRAFLGNVFWLVLLWQIERWLGWRDWIWIRIGVTAVVGWCLAFGFAVKGHRVVDGRRDSNLR
ncbi:acyltransferase [Furfurilactobacillus curtus]|uniref:Membrane protein n=1 Tax=Furfurilactobacillus curtus TaxID=1746200 RepID=A0ABQ5JR89_9LACO